MGSLFTSSYRYDTEGPYGASAGKYGRQAEEVFAGQQGLAQALQAAMSGAGPSIAEQSLKQGTNRAIKQTAASIASQKGINPALAQRLAAESAANMTQEAAGQGALMRAQEQLAARGQLGGVYGQMGSQALTGQGQSLSALQAQNQINAGIEAQNAANVANLVSGALQAGGTALGMGMGKAPKKKAKGGMIEGHAKVEGDSEKNDTVPAMLSPGEIVIPRTKAKDPKKAKEFVDQVLKGHTDDEDEIGYAHVLKAHNDLKEKVAKLEAKLKGKK